MAESAIPYTPHKVEQAKAWALSRVGNPYLMGGTGQPCTPSYRAARAQQYPGSAAKIRANCPRTNGQGAKSCQGCQYFDTTTSNGKRAYDCAQLTRWCMDSVGITLVSGATSQWNKTAWEGKGGIESLPRASLCLVFRQDRPGTMGHVGLYLGDGTVVHAKGHDFGVVRQTLEEYGRWTHWAVPRGLYEMGVEDVRENIMLEVEEKAQEVEVNITERESHLVNLVKGDKGEKVRQLQTMLMAQGMLLPRYGADGYYGNETVAALMTWQTIHGLPDTGACNTATWDAITAAYNSRDKPQTVTVSLADWEAVGKALRGALAIIENNT